MYLWVNIIHVVTQKRNDRWRTKSYLSYNKLYKPVLCHDERVEDKKVMEWRVSWEIKWSSQVPIHQVIINRYTQIIWVCEWHVSYGHDRLTNQLAGMKEMIYNRTLNKLNISFLLLGTHLLQ